MTERVAGGRTWKCGAGGSMGARASEEGGGRWDRKQSTWGSAGEGMHKVREV